MLLRSQCKLLPAIEGGAGGEGLILRLPLIAHLRAIENLLQNKCAVIRAFLPIDAKKSSWAEKSAQLEKNMFPVREFFFPSWKPQIRGVYENMTFPTGNPY